MTNERAIELLHRLQDEQFDGIHGDERREALEMAVRALEGDGDTISRKMAIDALKSYWKNEVDRIPKKSTDFDVFTQICDSILTHNANICKVIGKLPSAQPQRKKGEWEEIEVIPEAYDIAGVKTWASKMRCNQCGFTTFAIEGHFAQYDFCPNCGADMRGESDES